MTQIIPKNSLLELQFDKFNYKHSYNNGSEREKPFLLSSWKLKKIFKSKFEE